MVLILGDYYDITTTNLCLSGRDLIDIPTNVFKLINLEALYLNHNKIEKIPEQITKLHKLKALKISYNKLKHISDEILELSYLEHLHLSHNKIKKITPHISKLKHLKELYLFGNDIAGVILPKYINNLDLVMDHISQFGYKLNYVQRNIAKIQIQLWLRYHIVPKYFTYDDQLCMTI